jgi:hypothetical protein
VNKLQQLADSRPAAPARNGRPATYEVASDAKGDVDLPPVPPHDDAAAQCAWLGCAFNLCRDFPITGGSWQGVRGPDGHIVLRRASGAAPIRFEPASKITSPMRMVETFVGQRHPRDGMQHALKAKHLRLVAHVIGCLCDASSAMTAAQETAGIVGTFLQGATAIDGHTTHGTAPQRYEAALALRREVDETTGRPIGAPRYLIDSNTGELVIAVGELNDAARRHIGGGLRRGWLEARMHDLGWSRRALQGYAHVGRSGRQGPHARLDVYRGHLRPEDTDPPNAPVNT